MKEKETEIVGRVYTGKLLNKIKEQKGSITIFVLVACMSMITVLLLVNISIINKNAIQEKELAQIAKKYSANETDLANSYAKIADENEYVTVKQVQEMINSNLLRQYPVGSIYLSTNSINPSEYIGGTWESYGQGRTLVGEGTGTDSNNTQKIFQVGETGGEYTHTLSIPEMPIHSHRINLTANTYPYDANGIYISPVTHTQADSGRSSVDTGQAGGDMPHNNMQPYIVTYMWKRIA